MFTYFALLLGYITSALSFFWVFLQLNDQSWTWNNAIFFAVVAAYTFKKTRELGVFWTNLCRRVAVRGFFWGDFCFVFLSVLVKWFFCFHGGALTGQPEWCSGWTARVVFWLDNEDGVLTGQREWCSDWTTRVVFWLDNKSGVLVGQRSGVLQPSGGYHGRGNQGRFIWEPPTTITYFACCRKFYVFNIYLPGSFHFIFPCPLLSLI